MSLYPLMTTLIIPSSEKMFAIDIDDINPHFPVTEGRKHCLHMIHAGLHYMEKSHTDIFTICNPIPMALHSAKINVDFAKVALHDFGFETLGPGYHLITPERRGALHRLRQAIVDIQAAHMKLRDEPELVGSEPLRQAGRDLYKAMQGFIGLCAK